MRACKPDSSLSGRGVRLRKVSLVSYCEKFAVHYRCWEISFQVYNLCVSLETAAFILSDLSCLSMSEP